ncbi:hypothetical protein [uncultured Methylobacterium sp.]|uniref:hypothetical protein n=1 Tax=uncultured Methylobacterium sp. TaxID=157278 RepID=UPI0035CAB592
MSIADQTDLKVTAELLKANLMPPAPSYDKDVLKAAIEQVTERLYFAWRRPR